MTALGASWNINRIGEPDMSHYKPYAYRPPAVKPIDIGPRLRREIEHEIRRLEGRLPNAMTVRDHAELARLREILRGGDA